jgi:hypothetical protein
VGVIGSGLVLLAGCASLQQPDVERVAAEFATGDAAARCALLAPATLAAVERTASAACAQVVAELAPSDAQVLGTAVWGDAAQVRTGADTLFLTRTSAGWKVAAAGCVPHEDAPYECEVDGP